MTVEESDEEELNAALAREHGKLEKAGRLSRFHWLVVGGSIGLTLIAWHVSERALEERVATRFERDSEQVTELFTEQLQRHADVLQATASLLGARAGDIGHEEWKRYHAGLELPTLFPALFGLNVIHRVPADEAAEFVARRREHYPEYALHPAHGHPVHLPVAHSVESRRSETLGFDMAHEPTRREAIERALDTGRTRITAPILFTYSRTLGFSMFAPFRRVAEPGADGAPGGDAEGVVLALVRADNLAAGVLDRDKRRVRVRISDEGRTLYDELDRAQDGADVDPLFAGTRTVSLFGREWRFDIESTAAFRRDAASIEPTLILTGGLGIDTLLLGLFATVSRSNRRALSYAERASRKLQLESAALAKSNRTLESFAYAASHDLKTPLNGIGTLAEFIEEDLEGLTTTDELSNALPDIRHNVGRIRQQVRRSRLLVDGILEYSVLDHEGAPPVSVDTRALVDDIGDLLGAGPERLILEGDFPRLLTDETRLGQVFANLVGNAFKYHHDAAHARVVVRAESVDDLHRFSVEDDGPGIEPAYHERIFELFRTLDAREGIDSTGVGLSIVKKAVEGRGGSIRVDSAPGEGATFTFDWPADVDRAPVRDPSSENEWRAAA